MYKRAAFFPMSKLSLDDPVKSRISKNLRQISGTEVQPRVSFAPKRQNCVWTQPHLFVKFPVISQNSTFHSTKENKKFRVSHKIEDIFMFSNLSIHPGSEVDAEKGKSRVRHRVDVAVDFGRLLWAQ